MGLGTQLQPSMRNHPPTIGAVLATLTSQDHAWIEEFGLAATLAAQPMQNGLVRIAGTLRKLGIVLGQTAFAAGESVSIDVKKLPAAGGAAASILSAPIVVNSATAAGLTDESSQLVANASVLPGDKLTVDFTYTAGGGPAHPDVGVIAVWNTSVEGQ